MYIKFITCIFLNYSICFPIKYFSTNIVTRIRYSYIVKSETIQKSIM